MFHLKRNIIEIHYMAIPGKRSQVVERSSQDTAKKKLLKLSKNALPRFGMCGAGLWRSQKLVAEYFAIFRTIKRSRKRKLEAKSQGSGSSFIRFPHSRRV